MAEPQHFIVATAGHVDHGKSALIQALTGTDPDRLPEEKARGISIDIGFAQLELAPPIAPSSLHVGIVDVPGHQDFVKNMVAGVGAVDLALLIVAADDGWMPQTEEHLQILMYFGVRNAVVALTKADLAQDLERSIANIQRHLAETPFAEVPIIPTSVITGDGLDALKSALADRLACVPPPRDIGKPRLAVDRVFTLTGVGTVVTGTLMGGGLRRGQAVEIQSGARPARIRRIQSHGRDVETIGPGTRTALNLTDVDTVDGVHRGDVITLAGAGRSHTVLDVALRISARASRPLKDGARVRVHYGSGNVPALVALASEKELAVGTHSMAQLRLEAPVFLCANDHLAIRDWSEQLTLAGAVVLDPDASRRAFRHAPRQRWLARLAESLEDPALFVGAHLERHPVLRRPQLSLKSPFSVLEIDRAIDELVRQGAAVAFGDLIADAGAWHRTLLRAAARIDDEHRAHPEHLGLSLNDLRSDLGQEIEIEGLFDFLVDSLCQREFARTGAVIQRAEHRAELPEPLRAAGDTLRRTLAARPLEPPSRKELTCDAASQRALKFLIDTGEVVEITADLVLTRRSITDATHKVQTFLHEHGPATVSELRQALGSSRRVVVPLLEYLDRTFVTLRHGDARSLRR